MESLIVEKHDVMMMVYSEVMCYMIVVYLEKVY